MKKGDRTSIGGGWGGLEKNLHLYIQQGFTRLGTRDSTETNTDKRAARPKAVRTNEAG